ncbi:swarming motility protein ybiA, partial [Trifolium medium]|nr:swarming motility protein ybiA [Trifolium medium]
MAISVFDGDEDAYWWILCTEKHFTAKSTPEEAKLTLAVTAFRGRALTWWRWWY